MTAANSRLHGIMLTLVFGVIFMAGCLPSRQEHFRRIHQRRMQSFEQWSDGRSGERDKPLLEGPLDLEEAVRLTLAYNTEIQVVLQEKERARGQVLSAYSEALPGLDLSAGYTRLDEVTTVDLGVESFQIGDKDNYSYRVNVTQPLFKGGKIAIAQRAARLFSYMSDEKVRGQVEDSIFQVARAYFDAKLAESLIDVHETALQSAEKHLEDVRSRRRQGVATEYDVLRARVDVSNIRADLIEQENMFNRAATGLLRVMGASQESEIDLTSELQYADIETDFGESVKKAFANRPDIYEAEFNLDLQHETLKEAYSRYWPHLDAYFWKQWAKPDPHESSRNEWGDEWQAGLRLTWPLFDGLAREGNVIQQKALLRQRGILLSNIEEEVIQGVRNAILELENARELVQSQQLNLQRADRALELVQAGYREGVNTEVEVLDARVALTRARGLYYQALHRHTLARIELRRMTGLLAPTPGSRSEPQESVEPDAVVKTIMQTEDKNDETDARGER